MTDDYLCGRCLKRHKGEPTDIKKGKPICARCVALLKQSDDDVVWTTPNGGKILQKHAKRSQYNRARKTRYSGKMDWLKYT